MPAVNLYFQVHQPHRLRRYSVFESGPSYFDAAANEQILRKVAAKCYLPATRVLLDQVRRHSGDFRLAFSLTGCVIDQLRRFAPDVLDNFRKLAQTGCVEFLAETYDHSLASLYSHDEFRSQVDRHAQLIDELFGQRPVVFRNTELIYSNALADLIDVNERYRGVLTEGADQVLAGRSPNVVYAAPSGLPILTKNYRLSDDIAFRFTNPMPPPPVAGAGDVVDAAPVVETATFPAAKTSDVPRRLTAGRFAQHVAMLDESEAEATPPQVCNLFMDFETFGEHHWKETGILAFLAEMPGALLAAGQRFLTPRECFDEFEPVDELNCPQSISWADKERDLSAWAGNAMQTSALQELYRLRSDVIAADDTELYRDWRRLSTSDHFYYMCTKYFEDAAVHQYFSPYESPYDSYINFMNVLDDVRQRSRRDDED